MLVTWTWQVVSDIVRKSVSPVWMRSFGFDTTLSDFNYAPLVVVELWDYDIPPFQDEKVGMRRSHHSVPPIAAAASSTPPSPDHAWFPVTPTTMSAGRGLLQRHRLPPRARDSQVRRHPTSTTHAQVVPRAARGEGPVRQGELVAAHLYQPLWGVAWT